MTGKTLSDKRGFTGFRFLNDYVKSPGVSYTESCGNFNLHHPRRRPSYDIRL